MAATVTQIYNGEESGLTAGDNGQVKKHAKLSWHVMFPPTDSSHSPIHAETATGIPAIGAAHPADAYRYCKSVSSRLEKAGTVGWMYLVTADYENVLGEPPDEGGNNWNVDCTVSSAKVEEPAEKDANGDPLTNSAGQPFNPPINVENYYEVYSVSFNTKSTNVATIEGLLMTCQGCINSDAISKAAGIITITGGIGKIKLTDWSISSQYENGQSYGRVSFNLEYNWNGWTRYILDRGTVTNVGGVLDYAKTTNGENVTGVIGLHDGAYSATPDVLERTLETSVAFATLLAAF